MILLTAQTTVAMIILRVMITAVRVIVQVHQITINNYNKGERMSFKYKAEASSGFGITARVVAKSKNI